MYIFWRLTLLTLAPQRPKTRQICPSLVIFQLYTLAFRSHDLVTASQHSRPRGMGSKPPGRLAYTILLTPQRPIHRALHPSRRDSD